MGTSSSEESFKDLFAHEEWVRRLALRLCSGNADDVAQDTWLEVLRHPREARSARAWLGGIVRHLSRRARRDARTRAERELAGAHAGASERTIPGSDELLARAELQRRVLAAVASLDEPYRVVVLMRYYEGLDSEHIAERLALPSSTVRNRLSRAHERLRAKLDGEYGGDHAAWAALFAPSLASISSHHAATGVGIAMKIITASIAATVLVVAGFLWRSSESTAPLAGDLAAQLETDGMKRSRTDETSVAASSDSTRSSVSPDPVASVEHVLLSGTIRGGDTPEFADAQVTLTGADGTTCSATVSKNATYSVFGLRPGDMDLRVTCRGFVPMTEAVVLPPDQARVRHDVTLRRAIVLPVKFVVRGGGSLSKLSTDPSCTPAVVATHDQPLRFPNVLTGIPQALGESVYRSRKVYERESSIPAGYDGVVEIHAQPPVFAHCVLHDTVISTCVVRGNERELVFELDPAEIESKLGGLTLRCVDDKSDELIAGARIQLWFQDGGGTNGTTDEQGLARFERLAPGMRHLIVTAPYRAVFETWILVRPGENLDAGAIRLTPPATGSGRVVDAQGHGIATPLVAIPARARSSPRDAGSMAHHDAASDGTFRMSWMASGPVRLVAISDEFAVQALDLDAARSAATDLEIRLEKGTPITFRLPRGATAPVDFVLADPQGLPLRFCTTYPSLARKMQLKPGHYELRILEDDAVVRTEALDVGSDPILKELRTP